MATGSLASQPAEPAAASAQACGSIEVLRVAVSPHGACLLGDPLKLEICYRSRTGAATEPESHWRLRFVADLVHHKIPVELELSSSSSRDVAGAGEELAQLCAPGGLPAEGLPADALESLGLLEARLVVLATGEELAVVRLVTDVRRNSAGNLQRAVLDAFS
ncbi:unnamed protein product [Polarella glacialis]|uniref:Uncharacterized protein n=1 Tax=Polarella glacialis TaxID=89957 RepID=A0A813KGC7_POLGL|nr:unnamed protein product [Polarella glacialis]CAE8702237.1 unnamed protein product [Polarella glacialis]